MSKVMKTFKELREINVSEHIEKKNDLSYLSWTYAIDTLLQNDPSATWEFLPIININDTAMVRCEVSAFGKKMNMHLAVFDFRNQAIKNPNACQISNSMMRCLVKCIACFGIGLYIYAGEDLPESVTEDDGKKEHQKVHPSQPSKEDRSFTKPSNIVTYGELKGKRFEDLGIAKIADLICDTEAGYQKLGKSVPVYIRNNLEDMIAFINEFESVYADKERS